MDNVFTISEITGQIKSTLEEGFSDLYIEGEISNFKAHVSGHWYFTLKDSNAQINCTMWKGINSYVFFTPENGMKIIARGRITVYPPRGNYQFDVKSMKPSGVGELQAAFEKLKQRLSAEGLFDADIKKRIPQFPNKIGIVTASDGAAFRDMISVATRRFPLAELVITPAKVQGDGAKESIVAGIKNLNNLEDVDVIIIGRGGGSLEDLWAFNEESVARAVFESEAPIISGVGHEIDFTISDYVADVRAATPTAAMEIATPNREEIFAFIREFSYNSTNNIYNIINGNKSKIQNTINSYGFNNPQNSIRNKAQLLDNLHIRINNSVDRKITEQKFVLDKFSNSIENYNIEKVLKRGFALIKQDESIIDRKEKLNKEKNISIKMFDGDVEVLYNGEK